MLTSDENRQHRVDIGNARRAAVREYRDFMRLKASAHQIHKFMERHRLTPGVDWVGATKAVMAENYATRAEKGMGGLSLSAGVFQTLVNRFGKRDD